MAAGGEDIFHKLRDMALAMDTKKLGVSESEPAIGAVMDLSFEGGFATVTSFLTGDASVYLSSGGGFIGGGGHESIQKAAKAFVAEAAKALPSLVRSTETPLPVLGMTAFFAMTPSGLFTASEREQTLGEKRSDLSPLFYAGQNVITAYRAWQDSPKHH